MSIIDNVAELRARLEEIEAEKASALSGTDWLEIAELPSVLPIMAPVNQPMVHDKDVYAMLCYGPPPSQGRMVHDGWPPVQPENPDPILPLITPLDPLPRYLAEAVIHPTFRDTLQYKCETLKTQIRLYTRLRAECMQALREATERLAMLKDENAAL